MQELRELLVTFMDSAGVSLSGAELDELLHLIRTEAFLDDGQIMAVMGTDNVQSMRSWCSRHRVPRERLAWRDDVLRARRGQPSVARAKRTLPTDADGPWTT